MEKRKLLVNEQLDEEELYKKYYKYILESSDSEWKNGACYIRVSTNEQDKFSPRSQLKEILDYALDHHIFISKEFIFADIGKSGMKEIEKRTDLMKLIDIAKNRPFEVLLLYKFARFARAKEDSVYYKAKLRKEYNIDIVSIHEELPKDNSKVLVESVYEGEAEFYALNFKEESKRGKKEKVTRGEWLYAPPYGYKFDRNTQILVPTDKADIIKYIFETFSSMQDKNIKKMVKHLNNNNIPSAKGGLWSDRALKRILKNPAYIGYIRYCEGGFGYDYDKEGIILFKGKHEAIIEEKLFNSVQKDLKLLENKYPKGMKPAAKYAHWLSGLVKCDNCGYSLVRTALKTRKPYFQCTGYVKGYCNVSHHIREEVLVEAILNQIKLDFTKKLDIKITKYNDNLDCDINILEKEVNQLNNKLKRIKIAYEDGIDSLEEYKSNKSKILNKLNEINEKLELLKKQHSEIPDKEIIYNNCAEAYKILNDDKATLELKREIINSLISKIVYEKENERLLIYYKT